MTQPGETDDFAVSDHIKTLMNYSGKNSIQYVIPNNGIIPKDIEERYLNQDSKYLSSISLGIIPLFAITYRILFFPLYFINVFI